MEIYQTNDVNHEAWKDRYLIDFNIDQETDTKYFEKKEDLINFVESFFDISVSPDDSLEDIASCVLTRWNKDNDEDQYCNIHEFEVTSAA